MEPEDRAAAPPVETKSFKDKAFELPWCSIILVGLTITAHSLVLSGNLATAKTFENIGKSTGGWSDVGLSVSGSLKNELEHAMSKTSGLLTDALTLAVELEQDLNIVLGVTGNSTEEHSRTTLQKPADAAESHKQITAQVEAACADLNKKLMKLWVMLKPALEQIGKWLTSMGTKMQGFIEQFSTTIDKAQKIFDQVMEQLSGAGNVKSDMLFNTFNIFDIRTRGNISVSDIQSVSDLYSITALSGSKGSDLHKKYDADKNGELDMGEYSNFVEDEDIPNMMSYVLRTFSKKLSQIAGQMKGAKMRDEVADTVSSYFELMMAKNMTKVMWVSQALVNKSLPLEFTADILRDLVLLDRSTAKLTDLPVGLTVVSYMTQFDSRYLGQVLDQMADPAFWNAQGWIPSNQPIVLEQVKKWIAHPIEVDMDPLGEASTAPSTVGDGISLISTGFTIEHRKTSQKFLLEQLAHITTESMAKRMKHHHHVKRQERVAHHKRIFHSGATRHLYRLLLGQSGPDAVVGSSGDSDVDRVTKGGVPAAESTMQFANWLVHNATSSSQRYQNYSFEYAKTSTNPIDNFANQIQALVKKVQQFLNLMMQYSSRRGIDELEQQIQTFGQNAAKDLMKSLNAVTDQAVTSNSASTSGTSGLQLSMLQVGSRAELDIGDSWKAIVDIITAFKGILPTVVDDVKFAQKEVSAVSSTLESIFSVFKDKGGPIFDQVSSLYSMVWIIYFALFATLSLCVLFYAFWAQGFFGGPTPGISGPKSDVRCCSGSGFKERCGTCWNACTGCMRDIQDGHCCFWSCILFSEVIILVMFVISIVLAIVAGLKSFLSMGCSQIYVLGDDQICTSIVQGLKGWLSSFWSDMPSAIQNACETRHLVTCQAISDQLSQSVIYTVVGSFVAAILSIQLLFLSAQLHERAVWNNKLKSIVD